MAAKRCPFCESRVEAYPDGAFAMHAKPDGSLCKGTNCIYWETATIVINGVEVQATDFVWDPDVAALLAPEPQAPHPPNR